MKDIKDKAKYYVDVFTRELIRAEDRDPVAPPERYYEYCKGALEGVVIETYIKSYSPLELLDFAWAIELPRRLVSVQRDNHLEKNGVSINANLYRYIVPPEWYDAEVAKFEAKMRNTDDNEDCSRQNA